MRLSSDLRALLPAAGAMLPLAGLQDADAVRAHSL